MKNALTLFPREFAGRTAVVTGGTDGLGLDLARALVDLGCRVFICGRDEKKAARAMKTLDKRAVFIRADLADADQARGFIREVTRRTPSIDYLVNNVAADPRMAFEKVSVEHFDELIRINLRSYFLVTQAALPALKRGKGKAIVNIGTTNFMLGETPFTVYSAAKSGIVGFSRALARELGPAGIRVNLLSPGWIMTPKQLKLYVSEQDKKKLVAAQCLKFLLKARDVTPATLFLLSSWAGAVTGQNLVVDGGKVHL